MIICFPLDNTEYEANALGAWCGTRTRGVFAAENHFTVTANGDMTVTVSPGLAWLKAAEYWGVNFCMDASEVRTISAADGTMPRIDAVCLRLNKNTNQGELIIKKGSYSPQPPAITEPVRDLDYDEIYVATIRVRAGTTSILDTDITPQQLNEAYCGLMRDGVTGIPTQDLYNEWQAWMSDFTDESRDEFLTWFATVQDVLDGDTAGHLLNLITALDSDKANKAVPTADGNLAGLDADGNLVDSGFSAGNFSQSNRNLLDNWYFLNPINQRKATAYINGYTIDRWRSYLVNVALISTGLGLSTIIGTDAHLDQIVEGLDTSQTYTFSVLIDNTVYSVTGVPSTGATNVIIPNEASLSLTVSGSNVSALIGVSLSQGKTMTVKAAKLELGTTQTLARKVGSTWVLNDPAPNYQQELAKCMRYQIAFNHAGRSITPLGIAHCNPNNSGGALISVALPVPLRALPTVTISDISKLEVRSTGGWYDSFTALSVDSFGVGSIALFATNANALTSGFGDCFIINNGDLLLDANL